MQSVMLIWGNADAVVCSSVRSSGGGLGSLAGNMCRKVPVRIAPDAISRIGCIGWLAAAWWSVIFVFLLIFLRIYTTCCALIASFKISTEYSLGRK